MRFFELLIIFLVAVLGLLFHLKNNQLVTLNYYIGQAELPFSIFLIAVFGTGIFFGLAITIRYWFRAKWQARKLKKELKKTVKTQ